MADAPDKKAELGLRGDVGIKWLKGTGQFEEPVVPIKPVDVDATAYQVHMYLDDAKIGPVDKLAPEKNDDNNQEKIDKIKKKPIKWYVKVPGGDSHHDDYSYHSPPWDSSSGSSGASMGSPPYGSVPSTDPGSNGQSSPPADGSDPNNSEVDPNSGEIPLSPITNAPTQQAQFGGASPASPALTQRFNVFQKLDGANPMALRTFRKVQGISDIEIELVVRSSDPILLGSSIEMNLMLIPFTDLASPTTVYKKAFALTPDWGTNWRQLKIVFRGFDASQPFPITFGIERRNDVAPNDDAEVWVMETIFRPVR